MAAVTGTTGSLQQPTTAPSIQKPASWYGRVVYSLPLLSSATQASITDFLENKNVQLYGSIALTVLGFSGLTYLAISSKLFVVTLSVAKIIISNPKMTIASIASFVAGIFCILTAAKPAAANATADTADTATHRTADTATHRTADTADTAGSDDDA